MPLKPFNEYHPYGDTYAVETLYDCDGTCNEECYEQGCYSASKCKECDTIFCLEETEVCPECGEDEEEDDGND